MDRLKAMNAFVRVADLGSISAAARSLSTTQLKVSKQVSALEATLGVRLLQRGSSSVVLTGEGARFLESSGEGSVLLRMDGEAGRRKVRELAAPATSA